MNRKAQFEYGQTKVTVDNVSHIYCKHDNLIYT